jgi:arylsulfatase A-like enzyme
MARNRRPDVLIVLADQLRACSVGYAGEEAVRTPTLDRLAAQGAIFSNAVSMLPVCGPYRGALITGRTPVSTGLVLNDIMLRTDEVSIADCFRAGGYRTAYVGKWHLDGPDRTAPVPPGPRRQGFEHWMAANFEHNYDASRYTDTDGNVRVWKGWDAEAQTTHLIDHLAARDDERPCLAVLSWGPPHHPYRLVDPRYLAMYDASAIVGRPNCPDVPRDDLHGYYAQTTFLDAQLARLLAALDDTGMADDTIVVFTSDHGDMHGSHGVYKKQWPWNEALKVPFVLRYPRAVAPGSEIRTPINVIDVMPTLLALAGLPVPACVEGVDLSARLLGEAGAAPESVLIMNPCPFSIGDPRGDDQYPDFRGRRLEYRGVVTERHTYVRTIDGPWLLYDNLDDPYQMRNLVNDAGNGALRERLESAMAEHLSRIDDEFLPREVYYDRFRIEVDGRGKVTGIVENLYDRLG